MAYSPDDVDSIKFEDINLPKKLVEDNAELVRDFLYGKISAGLSILSILPFYASQYSQLEISIYRLLAKNMSAESTLKVVDLMLKNKEVRNTAEFCYLYISQLINTEIYKERVFKINRTTVENLVFIAKKILQENVLDLIDAHLHFEQLFEKVDNLYLNDNQIKKECPFELSDALKRWRVCTDMEDEADESIAQALMHYEKFILGSGIHAYYLAILYLDGSIAGEGVNKASAETLLLYATKKNVVAAMSAHIDLLVDLKRYDQALLYAKQYLSLFFVKDKKFVNEGAHSGYILKSVNALLRVLYQVKLAQKEEVALIFNLCQKMVENLYCKSDDLEGIFEIKALITAQNDPYKINIALDKFVESSDFKIGQFKSLWQPSTLVISTFSGDLEKLDLEFPWMHKVTKNIKKQVMAREFSNNRSFKIRPILLVGLPGGGKTTYCKALAKIVSVPFRAYMAAGAESAMAMRGTPRGYATASPGFVPRIIAQTGVANVLILIDEIDKSATDSRNGSLHHLLLQLLEPATSAIYYDEALEVRLYLSHVNWIATANSLSEIPKPLLSRFEVILTGEPDQEGYARAIAKTRADYAEELAVDARMVPQLSADDVQFLISNCKSLREIARITRSILEERMCAKKPMMH